MHRRISLYFNILHTCKQVAEIYNTFACFLNLHIIFVQRINYECCKQETLNTMKRFLIILFGLWALVFSKESNAQEWAVKSNLFYDATTTINLGVEKAIAEKWTFDLSGNWNPFQFSDNKKWKHWLVQPEFRYWTCRKFGGHFLAGHLVGGQYNFGNLNLPSFLGSDLEKLDERRYEGWFAGVGLGYGYAWMLGKHWNLEAEICIGVAYTDFTEYFCPKCGEKIGRDDHIYYGPTKAAINLVYLF